MEIDSILSNLPEKVSDPNNMAMQIETSLNFNDMSTIHENENLINSFGNNDSVKKIEVEENSKDVSNKNASFESSNSNSQEQAGSSMNILDCINNYTDIILSDKLDESEQISTDENFKLIAQSLEFAQDTNNSNDFDQFTALVNTDIADAGDTVSTMDDFEAEETVIEKKCKRKMEDENEHQSTESKKKHSAEEKKCINIRKNIREIMEENQLDATTLAAQRQESERLARVQEQQKVVREIQRQIVINRQTTRAQQFMASRNIPSSLLKSKSITITPTARTLSQHAEKFGSKDVANGGLTDTYIVKGVAEEITFQDNKYANIDKTQITVVPAITKKPAVELVTIRKPVDDEPKEVVTITDSSSDDDCIVLSDDEEIKEEPEDDPHNSGLHVNDLYNIPDENGRVVINIGHTADETDIFVAPQIERIIKPHQIGGIRFLFDNIIESVERFNQSSGFGCILAHSMGLGKTLQVICFCDIFFRHTNSKTVLCIMPINTLQNWVSEFNKWLPANVDESQTDEIRARNFKVYVLNDQSKSLTARAKVILQWSKEGGVLLMGYELFRLLSLKLVNVKRKSKAVTAKKKESEAHKRLIEEIHCALVKPGPDLVICDEGHRIKNSHAGISVALKQIRTKRRIVLTGYPLQNNLLEYWCMVDFVRPNYLGTRTEFCNMFERPIQNGQCIDSTPNDIKFMRYRAHVLHSLLVGFVQRRSHMVLQNTLPQKQEYVILVRMTSFQRKLYEVLMNDVVRTKTVPNPLKAFAVCCKIWNHPDVLYNFLKTREPDFDLEVEDTNPPPTPILSSSSNSSFISAQQMPKSIEDNGYCSNENSTQLVNIENTANVNNQSMLSNEHQFASGAPNYWNESSNYFGYDCTNSNAITQKPDFIGTIVNPVNSYNKSNDCSINKTVSSEIVDLDTKEIKTVPTDMNLDVDQIKKESVDLKSIKTNEAVVKPDIPKPKDDGIPYDWAIDLMKGHIPDLIENSPKMEIFFCLLEESLKVGDRILLFSQSLLTLNLIERFLQRNKVPGREFNWSKNTSYFRIDGSTSAMEREKLINEFNSNENIFLFLVSTKAGSLGINLVGANRVIVFDASWNPCHDIQAVCRVYRYGQQKPCFIYRMVMDNCLEKKIYDRQINKQGMADRVVDECNPDAHLSLKEVTNLCYDYDQETEIKDFSDSKAKYPDISVQILIEKHSKLLSKEPFFHESLLVDRKEKKLSSAEKRMAQRSYEIAKKAATKPLYHINPNTMQYRTPIVSNTNGIPRPIVNVRPNSLEYQPSRIGSRSTRWIPAEVWQRQGMTAQEMILPLDVVIPTSSGEKSNILLKAGQKVMVLKSTKGVYMQLESGKIIAIRTSTKLNAKKDAFKESGGIEITTVGGKTHHRFRPNLVNTSSSIRRGIMINERHGRSLNHSQASIVDTKMGNKESNSNHCKSKNSSNTTESDSDDVIVLNDNCDPLPTTVKMKRSPIAEAKCQIKNEVISNSNNIPVEHKARGVVVSDTNLKVGNEEIVNRQTTTMIVPNVQQTLIKSEQKTDEFMKLPALTPLNAPIVKNVEVNQHVETKHLDVQCPKETEAQVNDTTDSCQSSSSSHKRFMPNIRNIPAPYPSISMLSGLPGNQENPVYTNNKYNTIDERANFDKINTTAEKYSDPYRNEHSLIETKDAIVSKPFEADFRQQFTPLQYFRPPLQYNEMPHQSRPEPSSNLGNIDPISHSLNFGRRDIVHPQYTSNYDNTNLTHTTDHSKPFNNYYYDSYDRTYDPQYYHNAAHSFTNNYSQHSMNKTSEDLHYLRYPLPHNSNPTQDQCNNYPSTLPYCPPQKNHWQHE